MIAERPRPWLGAGVRWLLQRRLRGGLAAVRVVGLERLQALAAQRPLLICGNHVCFWDGLVISQITTLTRLDTRVLMRAEPLRQAPLLRWAGCFGLEAGDPRDGARVVRHAAALLDRPGRAVWVFPQGAQRPQWERPLGFSRGFELIARRAPRALLVPLSLHYELCEREQPEAWVHFGPPVSDPSKLEAAVTSGLDALMARVRAGPPVPSLWPEPRRLGEGPASRLLARVLGR